jgi:Kef-type K+ transport system membrane component KefB
MHFSIDMLLPLAGLIVGARAAARVSERLGLPAVFGELLLGLILGPALLGWCSMTDTLRLLAEIGVILLMFLAGLETDLGAMKQVGRTALLVAIGGVILPLGAGLGVGVALRFSWRHALFLGAVLTATSVSITAQALREMGWLRSRVGSAILGAAVIDDVLGVSVLALVLGLSGEGNGLLALARMAAFFPVAWLAGDWLVRLILRWEKDLPQREVSLGVFLGLLLVYAWAAETLGSVAAITGAYLLGLLVARRAPAEHIVHTGTAALGYGFFIPLFFISIGLQAQAGGLLAAPMLTGALILLATASKLLGCGAGALLGGMERRSALQVGCGMVARGEVALVIAGSGLAAGLLEGWLFSILIVVVLATTLATPALLRIACRGEGVALGRQQPAIGEQPAAVVS